MVERHNQFECGPVMKSLDSLSLNRLPFQYNILISILTSSQLLNTRLNKINNATIQLEYHYDRDLNLALKHN